jgi:hypothetical protein
VWPKLLAIACARLGRLTHPLGRPDLFTESEGVEAQCRVDYLELPNNPMFVRRASKWAQWPVARRTG